MERNLQMLKGFPFIPALVCRKIAGARISRIILIAAHSITGEKIKRPIALPAISSARFAVRYGIIAAIAK
jgi:hypothetical protein